MMPKRSLGTRILIGVIAGAAVGIFLGELAAPLGIVGKIYVGLLQMTVLPYVTISLISKIGGLGAGDARRLGGQAGVVMLLLWALCLGVVFVLPLSLPTWEAGTFFSSSLVEAKEGLDFLDLYLPVNPFHSLANNIVPAAVLFSICVGIAMIAVPGKERILEPAEIASAALGNISNAVVALSPLGTFAMTADAAGRLAPSEMTRLVGYVSTNTIGVVFLTFVGLPALVAALTPFRMRSLLKGFRSAGLTAFATGKLFAVLPMVIDSTKAQLVAEGVEPHEADDAANVYVPLGYPFPNAGKILAILFIPFAAWYVGQPLELADYPMLLVIGLLAFFGSAVAAIPFLLDMLHLPQDLFPLFLVAGIWSARLGDVAGAMHLTAFTVLCGAWSQGMVKVRAARVALYAGVSTAVLIAFACLNYIIVDAIMSDQEPSRSLVERLELTGEFATYRVLDKAGPNPVPLALGEPRLDRMRRTKTLRVGYVPDSPPFCYRNGAGRLVGYDVDMVQRLAFDLGVSVEYVPVRHESDVNAAFAADHCDLAVGGMRLDVKQFVGRKQSRPYMAAHVALLVPDRDVRKFSAFGFFRGGQSFRLGIDKRIDIEHGKPRRFPGIELVGIESTEAYLAGESEGVDALVVPAEVGAYFTMTHPEFALVVPKGRQLKMPLVILLHPESSRGERFLDLWLLQRRSDGTLDDLYDHWILGKQPTGKQRRWSVLHDVLGWID